MSISYPERRTYRGLLLLIGVSLIAGCGDTNRPPPVEFRIPVEVADVTTSNVEDLISTTGTLRTRRADTVSYTHLTLPTNREV